MPQSCHAYLCLWMVGTGPCLYLCLLSPFPYPSEIWHGTQSAGNSKPGLHVLSSSPWCRTGAGQVMSCLACWMARDGWGAELWLSLAGRSDASCSAPQGKDTDGSTICCAVSGGTACLCLPPSFWTRRSAVGLSPIHRHWLSWQNNISKHQIPSYLEMIGMWGDLHLHAVANCGQMAWVWGTHAHMHVHAGVLWLEIRRSLGERTDGDLRWLGVGSLALGC